MELLPDPLGLRVSTRAAREAIQQRTRSGEALLARRLDGREGLEPLTREYQIWSGENRDVLRSLFVSEAPCFEYSAYHGRDPAPEADLESRTAQLREDIRIKLGRLNGLLGRLEDSGGDERRPKTGRAARILVLHGEQDAAADGGPATKADEIVRFLRGLDLDAEPATALDLSGEAPVAAYAIVLLPPDISTSLAVGVGYLMATLGPAALTALRMDGAPGLAQVPDIVVDAGGAWKLFLARDLRRAGIQLDISRAAADL